MNNSLATLTILTLCQLDEIRDFLLLLFVGLLSPSVLLTEVLGVLSIQDKIIAVLDLVGGVEVLVLNYVEDCVA